VRKRTLIFGFLVAKLLVSSRRISVPLPDTPVGRPV